MEDKEKLHLIRQICRKLAEDFLLEVTPEEIEPTFPTNWRAWKIDALIKTTQERVSKNHADILGPI
jgi:hypothetical protein